MIRKPRTEKNFAADKESAGTSAACLNRIFKKVEIDGLSEEATNELADDIRAISDKFGICPKASVLLGAIMEKTNSSVSCGEEDLANYIGCTNIEFFGFIDALRELEDKDIVIKTNGRRSSFVATPEAIKAVAKETDFVPVKTSGLTTEELFTRFRKNIVEYRNNHIDEDRLLESLVRLVKRNDHLLFCRKMISSPLFSETCTDTERRMFFYLCHRYVTHGDQSVPVETLMNFTEFLEDDQRLKRHFANGTTGLQNEGLVTYGNEDGFIDTDKISLADNVKKEWFDEIELAPEEKVSHKNLISCKNIKEQELFYNPAEQEQIERLADLLEEGNFRNVQARLESEGMPKGFSCVFHGCPGSGKTASLKALAKRSGRDIFWVDLASIKSKWVGESEQNMKKIFDDYRKLVRTSDKAPILAVNEADAIFTRRITDIEHSADNMYNAMTDIVLNELENLDGILIATTNLVGNMMDKKDNAMERRFLFKVEFKTPGEDVRAKIWKSKIKDLPDEYAASLASRYKFSGGNIENIARKATVDYVLSGNRPGLKTLTKYCEEESISRKENCHIGF
ncbi:MAG: ATP-binding protein [Candidatus Cryptobacteroides sp.]